MKMKKMLVRDRVRSDFDWKAAAAAGNSILIAARVGKLSGGGQEQQSSSTGQKRLVLLDGILVEMADSWLVWLIKSGTVRVIGKLPLDIEWEVGLGDDDDEERPPVIGL